VNNEAQELANETIKDVAAMAERCGPHAGVVIRCVGRVAEVIRTHARDMDEAEHIDREVRIMLDKCMEYARRKESDRG
jgi:hypothetical protein